MQWIGIFLKERLHNSKSVILNISEIYVLIKYFIHDLNNKIPFY